MAPPQIVEVATLENTQERINIKELARKGYYLVPPKHKFPEIELFDHVDRGLSADPSKASLFNNATKVFDLTPQIGTEIHGLQLSEFTDQQKNDLALLLAERGVVFFRDQKIDPYQGLEFGRYFGPLHTHLVVGHPPGLPEILPIYYGKDSPQALIANEYLSQRTSSGWHSDASYELQPPAITFLKLDTLPTGSGGDTIWLSGYAAYDRLSPELKKRIEGLEAVHSGDTQVAGAAAAGGISRRDKWEYVQPVVRTHPVTGWKSLFVNPIFTRRIVGFSKHESDALLNLLYDHLAGGYDFHVRFRWTEDAVAVWDNRVTAHSAIFDYNRDEKRHGWRVTSLGEKPYFDPNSKSKRDVEIERRAAKNAQ